MRGEVPSRGLHGGFLSHPPTRRTSSLVGITLVSPPDSSALNGRGYDGDDAEGRPIASKPTLRLLAALTAMRPGFRCLVRLDLFGSDGERLPLPPRRMVIHWPGEGSSEVAWSDTCGYRAAFAKVDLVAGPEPKRPT